MASNTVPNSQYSFTSPRRQLFSFPQDVISSMLEKPSSHKGLLKLYQTCKYLYSKRPILIVEAVVIKAIPKTDKQGIFTLDNEDITKFHDRIWVTDVMWFEYMKIQLPTFFRFSAEALHIYDCPMKYEDFVRLTAEKTVKDFEFNQGSHFIVSNSGEAPTIDEILTNLPNVSSFEYGPELNITLETLIKLNELKFNNKLTNLWLDFDTVSEDFDFNLLCTFIEKNVTKEAVVEIIFFEEETKERLEMALERMDPKWRTDAHDGLKKMFEVIEAEKMDEEEEGEEQYLSDE